MRTVSFQFLQINRVLTVYVHVCVHAQVSLQGAIRVGWFSKEFQFVPHRKFMWMPLWGKETKVGRQREEDTESETEGDVLWFTVPPPKLKPQPQKMLQALVTDVWGWQEDGSGSRFNQTDLVPSSDLMTAWNSHVKKCRQVVLGTPDPLNGP